MSRIEGNLWFNKPMLLMATAPGGRGGLSVLEIAKVKFPRMSANITSTFSLPFFSKNFSEGKIIEKELDAELKQAISEFNKAL